MNDSDRTELRSERRDWPEAVRLWQQVLDKSGDRAPANVYRRLSRALRFCDDLDGAQGVVARGLRLYPGDAELTQEHAELASARRNWPDAVRLWRKVLDAYGDRAPANVYRRLSRALRLCDDLNRAQSVVDSGLSLYPGDAQLTRERAELASARRNWLEAIRLWQQVLEAFGDQVPDNIYRRISSLAARMYIEGDVSNAGNLLGLSEKCGSSALLTSLRLSKKLTTEGLNIPPRSRRATWPVDDLAYVAASAQPFHLAGYTVRTQQLLSGLVQVGISVTCYVRPGFPWDVRQCDNAQQNRNERYSIDDVNYVLSHLEASPENQIEQMAETLVRKFEARPPAVVQAASNYRNALPALIAARRVGSPFIYEVRGLWELTAASRIENWLQTERFALERRLELLAAGEADMVLAITNGVREELIAGGVPAERIQLLTNAVDATTFKPLGRDAELAHVLELRQDEFVLVYAGSLTSYEGLDDVVSAVDILRRQGVPAHLLIVGDGAMRASLEAQVASLNITDAVTFVVAVPPKEVVRYISLAHAVTLPRKPYRVCELVSPLKPFEAMAMAKVVVVSDLPALTEIVEDGVTGLVCQPANPADLAGVLRRLHAEPDLAKAIGARARSWVEQYRSWDSHARELKQLYGQLAGMEQHDFQTPLSQLPS